MCPAARDYGCWQAIFSRESGRISRKNCAVQRSKGPPIGPVDMFQTGPKAPVCRDRRPRAASLAPSCQFPFCPHRPAGPMALTVSRSRGRMWAPAPTTLRVAQYPRLQVGAALVAARLGRDSGGVRLPRAGVGTRPYGSALMKELVQKCRGGPCGRPAGLGTLAECGCRGRGQAPPLRVCGKGSISRKM